MKLDMSAAAGRYALLTGLAAAVWLTPSVSTSGVEVPPPSAAGFVASEPAVIHLAQADASAADRPVSYSMDQADRGEERYTKDCEECHGDDLRGGLNGGAPLRGLQFEEKYTDGLPASLLFSYMSSQMPPNAPGRYPASTYADLMAYILKRNGFQPGAPLPGDMDALGYLVMDK